jgi:hypothetical protein
LDVLRFVIELFKAFKEFEDIFPVFVILFEVIFVVLKFNKLRAPIVAFVIFKFKAFKF